MKQLELDLQGMNQPDPNLIPITITPTPKPKLVAQGGVVRLINEANSAKQENGQ